MKPGIIIIHLQKGPSTILRKNFQLRKEADEIILQLWNEVENTHSKLPEEIRKSLSEEYGLVYFYRKGELEKATGTESQTQRWA